MEETYLNSKGVTDKDMVDVVKKWMEDTGKSVNEVANHPFVQAELEKIRISKANAEAADVKGEGGSYSAEKRTAKYWIDKGELPDNPESLDRDTVAEIAITLADQAKKGKRKFWNDPK